MQSLIVVPANDIETQGIEVQAELPPSWLDHQLAETGAVARAAGRFAGRLSRSGKADVVVRAKVAAELAMPCARCLAPTQLDVKTELSLLLKPGRPIPVVTPARAKGDAKAKPDAKAKKHAEYEFAPEEADLDEYDGEKVVLDPFVREAILLELPSFPLCREDCEGMPKDAGPGERPVARSPSPPPTPSPFAALRHLLDENSLRSDESGGNSARPSAAEVRRAARVRQRDKPKIRSSITGRNKKS